VGVVVFDADVLIAYLSRGDAHHEEAVGRVRHALVSGTRRLLSAVTYSELLIGPLRAAEALGKPRSTLADVVDAMLVRFGIETIQVDMDLARRAAAVRARTDLELPDAYAVATAIHAEKRGWGPARLESFDLRVVKSYAALGFGDSADV
jgi:predicted nucleic acid-binding protein